MLKYAGACCFLNDGGFSINVNLACFPYFRSPPTALFGQGPIKLENNYGGFFFLLKTICTSIKNKWSRILVVRKPATVIKFDAVPKFLHHVLFWCEHRRWGMNKPQVSLSLVLWEAVWYISEQVYLVSRISGVTLKHYETHTELCVFCHILSSRSFH